MLETNFRINKTYRNARYTTILFVSVFLVGLLFLNHNSHAQDKEEEKLAHGVSVGYIGLNTIKNSFSSIETVKYKLTNWPIYYTPKAMFGKDKFKGFIKGAVGIHISIYAYRISGRT